MKILKKKKILLIPLLSLFSLFFVVPTSAASYSSSSRVLGSNAVRFVYAEGLNIQYETTLSGSDYSSSTCYFWSNLSSFTSFSWSLASQSFSFIDTLNYQFDLFVPVSFSSSSRHCSMTLISTFPIYFLGIDSTYSLESQFSNFYFSSSFSSNLYSYSLEFDIAAASYGPSNPYSFISIMCSVPMSFSNSRFLGNNDSRCYVLSSSYTNISSFSLSSFSLSNLVDYLVTEFSNLRKVISNGVEAIVESVSGIDYNVTNNVSGDTSGGITSIPRAYSSVKIDNTTLSTSSTYAVNGDFVIRYNCTSNPLRANSSSFCFFDIWSSDMLEPAASTYTSDTGTVISNLLVDYLGGQIYRLSFNIDESPLGSTQVKIPLSAYGSANIRLLTQSQDSSGYRLVVQNPSSGLSSLLSASFDNLIGTFELTLAEIQDLNVSLVGDGGIGAQINTIAAGVSSIVLDYDVNNNGSTWLWRTHVKTSVDGIKSYLQNIDDNVDDYLKDIHDDLRSLKNEIMSENSVPEVDASSFLSSFDSAAFSLESWSSSFGSNSSLSTVFNGSVDSFNSVINSSSSQFPLLWQLLLFALSCGCLAFVLGTRKKES